MSRIDDIVTFDSDRPLSTNEKALLEIKEAVFPAIRNAIDDALAARPDLMDLVRRIDDAANDGRGSKGMFRHNFAIWHRLDAARRDDLAVMIRGRTASASRRLWTSWATGD